MIFNPTERIPTLADIAPNFKRVTDEDGHIYVEIPDTYKAHVDATRPIEAHGLLIDEIQKLIKLDSSRPAQVYDTYRDDGKSTREGWLVPLGNWDSAMARPLCGWRMRDNGDGTNNIYIA